MAAIACPMRRPRRWLAAASPAVLWLCLAGCAGGSAPAPGATPPAGRAAPSPASPEALGPDGRAGCAPPSPIGSAAPPQSAGPGGPEVRGTGHGVGLWGLIMVPFRSPLIRSGDRVKIVWRMTGTGELRLSAVDPDGRTRRLDWGPEAHGGSSYRRPGDEWGAGYRFDRPGCWDLHAARGIATADVWIEVGRR
ncbi:hypothetical protein [Actinoallomurus iriomotensis]|uniref:Plastocyanin-like domain-containing protein n=1 Tax=Actinoallomurus iriomotensis TaxID=478107 RepID=A0A9W6VIS1_9ACTN|nr:hypothetical protein [Actinoallomurus iriomotensis]GLY73253.1 hypothetical protein Airi01_015200 [Actinoallomurus iriomotensis]